MHFVGVDLAWGPRNQTGLAALDDDGVLLDLTRVGGDAEILDWTAPYTRGPCVVALDAPVIVTNPTGRRRCEAELGRVFGRYDAGAHPSNTARPELADGTRALRLARALDLDLDPWSSSDRKALEVYPHPATVALFGLSKTLKYKHKPGRDLDLLRAETVRLLDLLEGLDRAAPRLSVREHPGWQSIRRAVEGSSRKVHLKRVEDVVDAVLCAYIGLFAHRRPDLTTVFGDAAEGSIVTPALCGPAGEP